MGVYSMRLFADIIATAALHKGGMPSVEAALPRCLSAEQLQQLDDARLLSILCLRVFQAGLKHDLVAAKWPHFEQRFHQFAPSACAMLSDEDIEQAASDRQLIRHLGKLKAIRHNAQMVLEIARQQGSFAEFISAWPTSDIVGLWRYLKKHGAHLGGMSAARFLRLIGKDTFLLTDDVVAVLRAEKIVDKAPTSVAELHAVQQAFNTWQGECGRPLSHISRILSMTAA